jgi:hypothetical protein
MSDEDNKFFMAFGGRNRAIVVIVTLLVALALFIAGAVMLGVGIHKANTEKEASCPPNPPGSLTTTSPGKSQF